MASMYVYPKVPRLDPKEIPTPKCMYAVQPIFNNTVVSIDGPVVNGPLVNGDSECITDDVDLQLVIDKQEAAIKKLSELEARLSSTGLSEAEMIEAQMKSLLLRQDKLIVSIGALEQRLKNAASSDILKVAATSSTGDISIFVNWSSLPSKLKSYIKFFKTQGLKLFIQVHHHSSIAHLNLVDVWSDLHDVEPELNRVDFDGTISFIVREQSTLEPILVVDPNISSKIEGDDNIIKFLDQRFGHLLRAKH